MSSIESRDKTHHVRWPSAVWQSAFRDQATSGLIQAATRCATVEMARLRYHQAEAELSADDLVQTVLASTWEGTLAWRPEAVALQTHVQDEIRHACRHAWQRHRARRGPDLVALDALNDEDPHWTEVEGALAANVSESNHERANLSHRLAQELRLLATEDRDALGVLAALEQGVSGNLDLAEFTGLDVRTIDRTKNRLQRLGRRVSPELLADIKVSSRTSPDHTASNVVDMAAWSVSGSGATRDRHRTIKNFERANERRRVAR